ANFQCPDGTNAVGASVPASRGELPQSHGGHPQEPARQEPRPTNAGCKILVLLPSLALLRQTLHEWLRETRLPGLAYLCVCSDPTVKEGIDALTTPQSDLDFQVSTDAASVRNFLDASFAGVKMIFSTYQSASVVGAAMQPGEAFDFAVFDEAHKTAGREGRNFAFALDDKNLSIRKSGPGPAMRWPLAFCTGPCVRPPIPTGLNHSAQGCAGALPWVCIPQIYSTRNGLHHPPN
ncbi:MAG TPA: hypothetical protein VMV89_10990, partial [Candidatus Paceibacterota bacterium]|nr:hypothetical protein [Candidatus Paceibacterota bacterium]